MAQALKPHFADVQGLAQIAEIDLALGKLRTGYIDVNQFTLEK